MATPISKISFTFLSKSYGGGILHSIGNLLLRIEEHLKAVAHQQFFKTNESEDDAAAETQRAKK
jgi:hypothetical protein